MNPLRRNALLALGVAALSPALGRAQAYPSKPARVIVPFPPGALTDTVGRIVARHLQTTLRQPFVVENVGGANSVIGSERVARSAADGYTLLVSATHFVALPAVGTTLPYDPARDFTPIALLANTPLVLLVHPDLPVRTPAEYVAYAKAQSGGLSYGSSGVGSSIHFAGAMFAAATGAPLVHVPYQGSTKSIQDVVGGSIPSIFLDIGAAMALAQAGKVRAIGITSLERSPVWPEVPPLASVAPGFSIGAWYGLYGPAGLPRAIVETLNKVAVQAVNNPEVADVMTRRGNEPGKLSAAEFGRYLGDELKKWSRIAKDADIRAL